MQVNSRLFYIEDLEELFVDVQLSRIFSDSKTLADSDPKYSVEEILKKYRLIKGKENFKLKNFVEENFIVPSNIETNFVSDTKNSAEHHVARLWDTLTKSSTNTSGTALQLPQKFVVPGGRFREFFYWDSYFTMLGLQVACRYDLIESMIENFANMIDNYGHIPNGSRSYFLSRSQPPFFSMMVELLSEEKGENIYIKYTDQLKAEYEFWMNGEENLSDANNAIDRIVRLKDGELLNRYWDNLNSPRAEGYYEDMEEYEAASEYQKANIFRNIRAACESGWDFSGRWFADGESFKTINTIDILPIDLNCLLWHLEITIAKCAKLAGKINEENKYLEKAKQRENTIQKYLWNDDEKCFLDYNFLKQKSSSYRSMALAFPLFINIATKTQAEICCNILQKDFLKSGGLLTSIQNTGQQWDAPNGWAPLQWIGYKAALNYNFTSLAKDIIKNWTSTIERVFKVTGKMMEKYNVADSSLLAGGGEYENQDGFGWTNGVYLKMIKENNF